MIFLRRHPQQAWKCVQEKLATLDLAVGALKQYKTAGDVVSTERSRLQRYRPLYRQSQKRSFSCIPCTQHGGRFGSLNQYGEWDILHCENEAGISFSVVKATALNQQIGSKFYPQILSRDAT